MTKVNRILAGVGTVGALCVACCSFPILGLIGLGALEALFCENEMLQGAGIAFMVMGFGMLAWRQITQSRKLSCNLDCGCKSA